MPHQHPLSASQWSLRPDSAEQLSESEKFIRQNIFWSNTYTRKNRTTVDTESLTSETNFRYAIASGLEVDVIVPVVYRGGGRLDSIIKEWDSTIGFANEGRELAEDDQFEIGGRTRDGGIFDWDDDGISLGNIPISLRYELLKTERLLITGFSTLQLPVARDSFGLDGFDIATGALAESPLNSLLYFAGPYSRFHAGGSVSYSTDSSLEGVEYEQWRADLFIGTSVQITESWDSYIGVAYYSRSVENISGQPSDSLYLDVAVGYLVSSSTRLAVFCRENPLHSTKTTDVTVGISLKHIF